jgi:2-keto-4-pentenoate hydratase/2-oxohepta-3-ene-1,7-dioic acid hydratase in catechol pathway
MVFDVQTLICVISEAITLEPGDLIVTGTPAGVGLARKPPLWMKPGDVCEVEVEGLGILVNPVEDEATA